MKSAIGGSGGGRQAPSAQPARHQTRRAQDQALRSQQDLLMEPERKVPRNKLQREQNLQQTPQQQQQQQQRQQQQQQQEQRNLVERRNLDSRMTPAERVTHTVVGMTAPEYSATVAPVYSGVAAAGMVHTQALALANTHENVNGAGKLVRDGDY